MIKSMRVRTVELGVQSMDEEVLLKSRRGHTAEDVTRAVRMLKRVGLRAGVQLMPGLPGDSPERFSRTIEQVVALEPDMVRLYPALVIRGTELARMYARGSYRPLTLKQAVELCARAVSRFEERGIPVIRIGLMSSPSLLEQGRILAGPWHPALGFLVRSSIYLESILPDLPVPGTVNRIRLYAAEREIPLLRGYRNQGIRVIEQKTGAKVQGVWADNDLPQGRIRVEER